MPAVTPPSDAVSPLEAVKRYTCLDVPDRRRRLQALCLSRIWPERFEPALSWDEWEEWPEDDNRLWFRATSDFFMLWEQGKLQVWGYDSRQHKWVLLPTKLARSLKMSDFDWQREILFPKETPTEPYTVLG